MLLAAIQYGDFVSESQVQWGPSSNLLLKLLVCNNYWSSKTSLFLLV